MTNSVGVRVPKAELALLAAGIVSAVFAVVFDSETWLSISILVCILCAIAAVVSIPLSMVSVPIQTAVLVLGIIGTVFGIYWWANHQDEPEIFSPLILGYLAAALLLSSLVNLAFRQVRRTA